MEEKKEDVAAARVPDIDQADAAVDVTAEEDEGWDFDSIMGLVMLVLIGLGIWAMVHYNPTEEDHRDAMAETLAEGIIDEQYSILNIAEISKAKYGSLGVVSWTYRKIRGHYQVYSVGLCGNVFTTF